MHVFSVSVFLADSLNNLETVVSTPKLSLNNHACFTRPILVKKIAKNFHRCSEKI